MPKKILVVEDKPALQATLAYSLVRQSYPVEMAPEGPSSLGSPSLSPVTACL
jgi:DNA-binding response OmpR family regulator